MKTDAVEDFGNLKVINGKMPRSSLTSIRKGGRNSPVSNVSSFEKILSQILGIPFDFSQLISCSEISFGSIGRLILIIKHAILGC